MLAESVNTLSARCIRGITANKEHCREMVERSIGIITAVVPQLGYEEASEIAKEALETGMPVREIILKKGFLNREEIEELLSPESMTRPRPIKRN
jgi:aspartate ammonia-lyase